MTKVHRGPAALEGDGRNKLRAHWPPRRVNVVTVHLSADEYRALYGRAVSGGVSLAQAVRLLIGEARQ
jgi:hypothetical protein